MLSKQLRQMIETAAANGEAVTYIRNTAANGADKYIGLEESVIVVYNTGSFTQNIFLPKAGSCLGKIITIIIPDFGGGGAIADQDDSLSTWADLTNNADGEYAVVMSTGVGWVTLVTSM